MRILISNDDGLKFPGLLRLRERLDRVVRRNIAGLEMHPGDTVVVPADEAPQDFGKVAPLGRAQPPDDAEVDGGQVRGRIGEQIALVQVGVESAVI